MATSSVSTDKSTLMWLWLKHHGGHTAMACTVAFIAVCFGCAVWLAGLLGCIVLPTVHEGIEIWRGSRSTADWRDHVADYVTYQLPWVFVLIEAGAWGYAGSFLAFLAVSYAATLKWSRPGPRQS